MDQCGERRNNKRFVNISRRCRGAQQKAWQELFLLEHGWISGGESTFTQCTLYIPKKCPPAMKNCSNRCRSR